MHNIDKNGRFIKGIVPWNKGKTGIYSEETKRKISQKLKAIGYPMKQNIGCL